MEECFDELRREFLDNKDYVLRPMTEEEAALYPNVDDDYCLSKVIPT